MKDNPLVSANLLYEDDNGQKVFNLKLPVLSAIHGQPEYAADIERAIGRVVIQHASIEFILNLCMTKAKEIFPHTKEWEAPVTLDRKLKWLKQCYKGTVAGEMVSDLSGKIKAESRKRHDIAHGMVLGYSEGSPPTVSILTEKQGNTAVKSYSAAEIEAVAQKLHMASALAAGIMAAVGALVHLPIEVSGQRPAQPKDR